MGTRVAMEMELDVAGIRNRLFKEGTGESICGICQQIKPMTEFHKLSSAPNGVQYNCKPCGNTQNIVSRARVSANRANTARRNNKR